MYYSHIDTEIAMFIKPDIKNENHFTPLTLLTPTLDSLSDSQLMSDHESCLCIGFAFPFRLYISAPFGFTFC